MKALGASRNMVIGVGCDCRQQRTAWKTAAGCTWASPQRAAAPLQDTAQLRAWERR